MAVRIGIDTGGTFTDVAVLNEATGEVSVAKSPTTPKDHLQGVLNCLKKVKTNGMGVSYLVHGTTLVANLIAQRRLPKVALITTKGFRDILEIMRENRPIWGLFDIQWDKPKPLIPRHLRFEVDERVDAKGNITKPLNQDEVESLVAKLKRMQVESIAICLIFSHLNSRHENQIKRIIKRNAPEIHISLSSEVNPQEREYERTSTTAIDAATKPLAKYYFSRLEDGVRQAGLHSKLLMMASSGGLLSVQQAGESPVYTIESGPVGGTIGSAYLGDLVGQENLIAIDMGGTTFKVSIVQNGVPRTRSEGEIEWGIPFRTPMVDVSEIGAGGGSLAYIDREGIIRIGPQSAGADPGPVCYGRGGIEPTFTDACLVLGYLNPEYLLGGEMKIDRKAAEDVIRNKIARPLHLDPVEAAFGIIEISNNIMLGSMRVSSVEKGVDPRDFATIAYGGAGPMVAGYLARELGSPLVIIPAHPGIFSAIGMLMADIRLDFMHSFHIRAMQADLEEVGNVYRSLQREAIDAFRRYFALKYRVVRTADMRYVGQNYDLNVPVPNGPISRRTLEIAMQNFSREHQKLYGHAKGAEVEIVNLRVIVLGTTHKPSFTKVHKARQKEAIPKTKRQVYFGAHHDFLETQVYDRQRLGSGSKLDGPCIIEEADSTVIVYPQQTAKVDKYRNILIKTG